MQTKLIPAIVVSAQVLLGNLCFMPMAYAGDVMPMDHDDAEMEQVMEMVMTPANAMSPAHCEGCVTITRPKHHADGMDGDRMPCNDGHCLTKHSPSTTAVTQSAQKDIFKAIVRPAFEQLEFPETDDVGFQPRAGPDVSRFAVRTVVLRE